MAIEPIRLIKLMRGADDGFNEAALRLKLCELQQIIDKADSAYYRPGMEAILTDAESDHLRTVLKEAAPDDVRLTRIGLPYTADDIGNKVRHNIPMGSLDNTDDGIAGYRPWIENMADKLGVSTPNVMASLKVDGGSICATYRAGVLTCVATRGNGEEGENISVNAGNFRNLPTVLPQPLDCEVRGEAILYINDYKGIRSRELGEPFDSIPEAERSNPRNIGNGILGRHDGQDSDKIVFMAFNLVAPSLAISTEVEKLQTLSDLGFKTVPHRLCHDQAELQQYYNEIVEARSKLDFEIDGIVVVLNDIGFQNQFVTADIKTRLRPKYARAIKFPHKSNTTILKDVLVTVGHTRMIIPTAVLQEVRIGGVNVTSALLNNYQEIKALDLAIGDEVNVILSGDIIPKIDRKVSDGPDRKPIIEPANCPACDAVTTRTLRGKEGACTYCTNVKCSAAVFAKLDCWIGGSKKGVGILDIGDTMIQALWDNKMLSDPSDLYLLTVDALKDVSIGKGIRIGRSRAEKIVANIAAKKKLALHTFLGSLGIELLGRRRVTILREAANGQLDNLSDWMDIEKLKTIQLPGFGDAIRAAVVQGIEDNLELIKKLVANGVVVDVVEEVPQTEATAAPVGDKPFAGLSFCMTGTRAYQDEIVKLGGTLKSGISKGLDYLVQADATSRSNKTQKAESYGTQIIGVDYLKKAIDGLVVLQKAVPVVTV
jgi:DNA ligase (NAD+)